MGNGVGLGGHRGERKLELLDFWYEDWNYLSETWRTLKRSGFLGQKSRV